MPLAARSAFAIARASPDVRHSLALSAASARVRNLNLALLTSRVYTCPSFVRSFERARCTQYTCRESSSCWPSSGKRAAARKKDKFVRAPRISAATTRGASAALLRPANLRHRGVYTRSACKSRAKGIYYIGRHIPGDVLWESRTRERVSFHSRSWVVDATRALACRSLKAFFRHLHLREVRESRGGKRFFYTVEWMGSLLSIRVCKKRNNFNL